MHKNHHQYYNQKYFIARDHLDLHMAETIKILLQKNHYKKILDIGCGTGKLVFFLNQNKFKAFGCDRSITAVKFAQKINGGGKIIQASAVKLPYKNCSFDMITAISIIEHLSQKQIAVFLKESKRLLVKNGMLFIVTPNFSTPIRYFQGKNWFGFSDPTHINFFSTNTLIAQLKQYNFSNFKTFFSTKFTSDFDWDLPGFLQPLPKFIKTTILFLLISTPLCFIRNSFWLSARKQ